MLGEKIGRVSKNAVFILKNKVKIWTLWPFHSSITRMPGGLAARRPGEGQGPGSLSPATSLRHVTCLHLKIVMDGIIYYFV